LTEHNYTTRLQKGGALLNDMRLIVQHWSESDTHQLQGQRIIQKNLLGKSTKARSMDIYRRTFSQRYLKGDPPEAWKIVKPLENSNIPIEILKPVYYWITARSDHLLYDFVSEELFARSRNSNHSIRVDETAFWLKKNLSEQNQSWTETVTLKVARGMLAALRDFGILEGGAKKRIAPSYLPIESFAYLAFVLDQLGNSGESLINHSDWRLFLFNIQTVEYMFLEAHQNRFLNYQSAGKIYRIELFAKTIEEMTDVIAGK
jgi:hypothetical protein